MRASNNDMLAIWEDLWHSMPQSGKVSITVHELLKRYKERCTTERNKPRPSSVSPPALLPVSFAQAKDWLFRQQRAQSSALEFGAVNETARQVVADLNFSLAEQPPANAALLQQPARPASPVLIQPVLSLGPELVTDEVRAEERQVQKKAGKQAVRSGKQSSNPKTKKMKIVSPEMEECQQRATVRMQELGVQPLQVKNFVFFHLYIQNYFCGGGGNEFLCALT